MSDHLIPRADVEPVINDLLGALTESLTVIKSAQADRVVAQAKIARLERELADREIEITKVASAKPASPFADADVDDTIAEMVSAGLCLPEFQTKLAAQCKADPKSVLTTLRRVALLSNTGEPSGFSVAKTAGVLADSPDTSDEEVEDWSVLVRDGA